MKFSIIIPTLNRTEELERCIISLNNLLYKDYEIIIIDQSSNDETRNMIKRYNNVIYRKISISSSSAARNEGIKIAWGEYVCFLDDDAEYPEDYLNIILDSIEKNTDICGICGRILEKGTKKAYLRKMELINSGKMSIKDFDIVAGAALVLNLKILKKVGLFDERFGVNCEFGAAEEADLVLRLIYDDFCVYYIKEAVVYHPCPNIKNYTNHKIFNYGTGYGALCKKHFIKYHRFYFLFQYIKFSGICMVQLVLQAFKAKKIYAIYIIHIKEV